MTDRQIKALVRREVRAEIKRLGLIAKPKRHRAPCGRGNAIPECMGSAARGPDHCTCPGVRIEYY